MPVSFTRKSRAGVVYVTLTSTRIRWIKEVAGGGRRSMRAQLANTSKHKTAKTKVTDKGGKSRLVVYRGRPGDKVAKHWDRNERARYAEMPQHPAYGRRSERA